MKRITNRKKRFTMNGGPFAGASLPLSPFQGNTLRFSVNGVRGYYSPNNDRKTFSWIYS